MSQFFYNGVVLPAPLISNFEQRSTYDELGGASWQIVKYDIRLQSIFNFAYKDALTFSIPADLAAFCTDAPTLMKAIRKLLLQPRKLLSVSFNGFELIPLEQNDLPGTVDAQNGPKPQSCTIKMLTNESFLVDYHIIAHYWENITVEGNSLGNNPGSDILYNRWSETQSIDQCNFSTYTREGVAKIRSDNVTGSIADLLRQNMVPLSIKQGFIRKSANYVISPDGLSLKYQIVDEEQYKMPPSPAFKATGRYTDTAARAGAYITNECMVKLEGAKTTSQAALIQAAIAIIQIKVNRGNSNLRAAIMNNYSVSQDLYNNSVQVSCQSKSTRRDNRVGVFAGVNWDFYTRTPFSDGQTYQPLTNLRGNASILLQAAAYNDPSIVQAINAQTGQLEPGLEVGQTGKTRETT